MIQLLSFHDESISPGSHTVTKSHPARTWHTGQAKYYISQNDKHLPGGSISNREPPRGGQRYTLAELEPRIASLESEFC